MTNYKTLYCLYFTLPQFKYEFTSSGILYTNHINCRDQLCVNLDTGELIPIQMGTIKITENHKGKTFIKNQPPPISPPN